MTEHLDYNDPASFAAAAELLRRHDLGEPEANITSAVRDFLIATRLARSDEIVEENPPAQGSRRAVDLAASTPSSSPSAGSAPQAASTPTPTTSISSTTTWPSPRNRAASAWAS